MAEHDHPHADDTGAFGDFEKRAGAMFELLTEKGVFTAGEVRQQMELMESRTPALGAKVVAKAWTDPAFKARLLADARAALDELGIGWDGATQLVVVENTPDVHNAIVCTLCSCYPRPLLGVPPSWYKSLAYRSRIVVEPRAVLREFGLELSQDVEVRVHDSTADMRYLILPMRPAGTELLTEQQLADLVSRDSMIGTAQASPAAAAVS
jgi:nitrile hydratase